MRQVWIAACVYVALNLLLPTLWERFLESGPAWLVKWGLFAIALACVSAVALAEPAVSKLTQPAEYPALSLLWFVGLLACVAASGWWIFALDGGTRLKPPTPTVTASPTAPTAQGNTPTPIRFSKLQIFPTNAVGGQARFEVQFENRGDTLRLAYAHTTLFWVPESTDALGRDNELIDLWESKSGLDSHVLDRYLSVPTGGPLSLDAFSPVLGEAELAAWNAGSGFLVLMAKLHYRNNTIDQIQELCFYGDNLGRIHMCSEHNGDPRVNP